MRVKENRRKPNIILILVDDMGFSDIGCYGSEISTPNLDKMAENGIRFTQMYNCARCCPTRASLLTGLYPHQAGIGHMVHNYGISSYKGYLRDNCVTIAEVLKMGGYRTGMCGKWHVGGYYGSEKCDPGGEGYPLPIQRGFDCFYGTLAGAGNYYNPATLMEGDRFIQVEKDEDYYYTDAISEKAVEMIENFSKEKEPFFLYVAYTAPHWPLHALPEDIAKYERRYRKGWDAVRGARYERLIELGIIDSKWLISPRDEAAPSWEEVKNKEWEDMRMAVYAAQIDRMDQGVGKIMEKLKELNIEENTLVMFLSDNGGCAENLRVDVPFKLTDRVTRKGKKVWFGNNPDVMPGPEDTFMSYGLPWANVSNTPFRLYKHWVHEGGISTPFIVYWPAVVKKNSIVHQPVHVIDIMATCLEVAGVSYPEYYDGRKIIPLEGESFLPLLEGENWSRKKAIVWEHEGNRAVRLGEWKLVSKYPGKWELYNISEDRTELNDLAEKNKEKVKEMKTIYNEWASRCGVLPWEKIRRIREQIR